MAPRFAWLAFVITSGAMKCGSPTWVHRPRKLWLMAPHDPHNGGQYSLLQAQNKEMVLGRRLLVVLAEDTLELDIKRATGNQLFTDKLTFTPTSLALNQLVASMLDQCASEARLECLGSQGDTLSLCTDKEACIVKDVEVKTPKLRQSPALLGEGVDVVEQLQALVTVVIVGGPASPCSSLQERLLEREVESENERLVYWESIFVVLPCFSGYAALFGLQHEVKVRLRIADDSSQASHHFGAAVSCLYLFCLIFRIAHKVVFSSLNPRVRVHVALSCMMVSMLVMSVVVLTFECYDLYWVIVSYSLGGAAIGSFESNLLNCLTPFGHETKRLAILGIPLGVNTILIGGFFIMGPPLQVSVTTVFAGVAALNLIGMIVFAVWIPPRGEAVKAGGVNELVADCKGCRHWLPLLWHYPLAFAVRILFRNQAEQTVTNKDK
ncbi:unnamed protein product [Cladocopium goreaui]|uniref:Uncharacterized protein n=1 Tax=Cladocopium goreaui TaxID=2562237 RepID=A0A9P1CVP1_9DINO|nr:unnamed protein product [Cladocopium goreaui]